MSTDVGGALNPAQLMLMTQWLSPAFPVGSFAYSHGLEQALAMEPTLDVEDWLRGVLHHGAGRNDAILIRAAYRGETLQADRLARAFAPSQERLLETTAQGAAFCKTMRDAFDCDLGELTYPVALGAAAARHALPVAPVTTLYLHAFTSNLVSAAQRLSPLGQSRAQAITHRLAADCAEVTRATKDTTLDDLGGSAWAADVAAMQHETMSPRIFRT